MAFYDFIKVELRCDKIRTGHVLEEANILKDSSGVILEAKMKKIDD